MAVVNDSFGSLVFGDKVMKEYLSEEAYKSLKETMESGTVLDVTLADEVADAMKNWAISKGATHYTHWFQPLNDVTAEKHDAFLSKDGQGNVIYEFSGKTLIQGESDASSFPSGGIRSTFEARGYTAWDPNSYAFIKGNTLCVPTAFCSYGGEALDNKTPLLRSMDALNKQALRILKLFGKDDVKSVHTQAGAEQEYFLIDKELYLARKDLIFTGRTLFGAKPPKGQELDDHYFGSIRPRVAAYMEDLNKELWKLGIFAKTEHNEVAPSQHELAPIYSETNTATDHNQLTMEIMQKVADKHDLVCLLHPKPFDGVNGSGKHNNWSIVTDTGKNLLKPGKTPYENAQFLLFLTAVIRAVDEYQDLLRLSIANAGNDHRLGGNEAPPAIVSMFLGDELKGIIDAIADETPYSKSEKTTMEFGVPSLPTFFRDTTDRNRTSPFAFTGNKFEFRMPGSKSSISDCNVMINTGVADVLMDFADQLEKADDFNAAVNELLKKTLKEHRRIIFEGNGYSKEWEIEAAKRGLSNDKTTPDCLIHILDEKNIAMLSRHHVLSEKEIHSRYEIKMENYVKTMFIEAATMIDMVRKDILPAISAYTGELAKVCIKKDSMSFSCAYEKKLCSNLCVCEDKVDYYCTKLENVLKKAKSMDNLTEAGQLISTKMLDIMSKMRSYVDTAESITSSDYWPYPTYEDLLYRQ